MRLYSRRGATALDHGGQHYEAETDGGFMLPEEVSEAVRRFHVGGEPLWEDDLQRQHRLIAEEDARRRDPRTLLEAVEAITRMAAATPVVPPAVAEPAVEVAPDANTDEGQVAEVTKPKRGPGRPRNT